jgi:hypothetical protein
MAWNYHRYRIGSVRSTYCPHGARALEPLSDGLVRRRLPEPDGGNSFKHAAPKSRGPKIEGHPKPLPPAREVFLQFGPRLLQNLRRRFDQLGTGREFGYPTLLIFETVIGEENRYNAAIGRH